MKKVQNITAVLAMLFLITAILITSVQLAVYGDSRYRFYEKEYEKYNVTESLGMEMEDVMDVTRYMMAYLIGEEEELSVLTDVDGERQDFFNDQDRAHMADVKNLFLGGLKVRTVCLVIFVLLLLLLAVLKADLKRLIPRAYAAGVGVFLALVVLLGLLFSSDFTKYFEIFHEMFFTNDLWLFDPATDYMIRMLPEGFFSDMALRIVMVFLAGLALVGIMMVIWRAVVKKKERQK